MPRERTILREQTAIVLMCLLAVVAYGVVHDQITAHLCVEYFTVAHPQLIESDSAFVQGMVWGLAASSWVGFLLGLGLAAVSQSRSPTGAERLGVDALRPRVLRLLLRMGLGAIVAGAAAYLATDRGWLAVPSAWAPQVPVARHPHFMSAWAAHTASYVLGALGGTALVLRVWQSRGRPPSLRAAPPTTAGRVRLALLLLAGAVILWWRTGRN